MSDTESNQAYNDASEASIRRKTVPGKWRTILLPLGAPRRGRTILESLRAPAFSGDYRTSRARISSIVLALQLLRRGRIPRRNPHQRTLLHRQRQLHRHRSSLLLASQILRRGRIPRSNSHLQQQRKDQLEEGRILQLTEGRPAPGSPQ